MMAYLTRPDNGTKLFKNSEFSQNNKNKKPIDTDSIIDKFRYSGTPKNTFDNKL